MVYFNVAVSEEFINSPYNTRQDTFSDRVIRGNIQSSDGEILATTNVYDDGTEVRSYPYANMFARGRIRFQWKKRAGVRGEFSAFKFS